MSERLGLAHALQGKVPMNSAYLRILIYQIRKELSVVSVVSSPGQKPARQDSRDLHAIAAI